MHRAAGGRLWFGLILITLGILFLLDQFGKIHFGDFIGTWWPSLLILGGLIHVTSHWPRQRAGGVLLILIGVFFQISNLDLFRWWSADRLWPVVLIVFGLWILIGRARRPAANPPGGKNLDSTDVPTDVLDAFAFFSGVESRYTSQQFRGGEGTAVFGGIEVDLTHAALAPGEQRMDLTAVFGGIKIRAPESWEIIINGTPILGGITDKRFETRPRTAPAATGSSLHIHATAICGGVELHN